MLDFLELGQIWFGLGSLLLFTLPVCSKTFSNDTHVWDGTADSSCIRNGFGLGTSFCSSIRNTGPST